MKPTAAIHAATAPPTSCCRSTGAMVEPIDARCAIAVAAISRCTSGTGTTGSMAGESGRRETHLTVRCVRGPGRRAWALGAGELAAFDLTEPAGAALNLYLAQDGGVKGVGRRLAISFPELAFQHEVNHRLTGERLGGLAQKLRRTVQRARAFLFGATLGRVGFSGGIGSLRRLLGFLSPGGHRWRRGT